MQIYVGNMSYQMTEDSLSAVFAEFGEVSKTVIISDRETGRAKGFGFVTMDNEAEAKKAIEELNEKEFDFNDKIHPTVMSVIVDKVVRDDSEPILKYDPTHPDANKDGYVAYPNINPVVEMADLIEATRAYQANVSAFQSAKSMANSAIDLLRA